MARWIRDSLNYKIIITYSPTLEYYFLARLKFIGSLDLMLYGGLLKVQRGVIENQLSTRYNDGWLKLFQN